MVAYPRGVPGRKSRLRCPPVRNDELATFREIDKFYSVWCENCAHDQGYRDEVEGDTGCPILLEALFTSTFPDEWVGDMCEEFKPWTGEVG